MSNYKIIFLDINGTLVSNETNEISENLINYLKKLQENKIFIVINTFVDIGWAEFILEKIYFNEYGRFIICDNGSSIYEYKNSKIEKILAFHGVNKGTALKKLSSMLSIDTKNTIAIGDTLTDKEMLKKSGLGVAVGGSQKELLKHADKIIGKVEDDSIYNFLLEEFKI